jgi:hypothetical protein
MRYVVLVALMAALPACSSSSDGGGPGTTGKQCTLGTDCASGMCVDGKCVAVEPQEDAASLFDTTADDGAALPEGADAEVDTREAWHPPESTPLEESANPPTEIDPAQAPSIVVDPTDFTFTYVQGDGTTYTKQVIIGNGGPGPLTLKSISFQTGSSPEYFLISVPPPNTAIGPYKQASATVAFLEGAQHGTAVLVIESNDPANPVVLVNLQAYAKITQPDPVPCIDVYPKALNFGHVERGTTKEMVFHIHNCDPAIPLVVTKIERKTGLFMQPLTQEFQLVPQGGNFTIQPGAVYDQKVTYTPGLAGPDAGAFTVKSTDPDDPAVDVQVSGIGDPPPLEKIGLHIVLDWDADDCDVDTHLLRPAATFFDCVGDCHFGNPSPDWGVLGDIKDDPFLDYDDVDGYGPENINLEEPQPGTYKLIIHYYRDSYDTSSSRPTNATVRIYEYGQLKQTFGPTNLDSTNWNWDVCTIDWPAGTINTLGSVYQVSDGDVKACLNLPF